MPVDQITNPTAQEGETYLSGGQVVELYQFDPAGAGTLVNGSLVALQTLTAPSLGPALIRPTTTTQGFNILGIVVGAPTGGITPGGIVMVCVEGFALALFGATTTAQHLALSSTTTAGICLDSASATLGQTIAVILEAVTIASGTALVPVYVHKM